MAPSAALWKLSMDPLLGGLGSVQPAEMIRQGCAHAPKCSRSSLVLRPAPPPVFDYGEGRPGRFSYVHGM